MTDRQTTTPAIRGTRRRRGVLTASCGLALALVTACGSTGASHHAMAGSPGPAPSPVSGPAAMASAPGATTPASEEAVIHIRGFTYQVPTSVSPGAQVSVMDMDGEAHTVTADAGDAFDVQVPGDASGTFTAPTTPGTYAFHCTYHSNMHGVLVVQ